MLIRKATIKDAVPVAGLLLLAMEEIVYRFMGKEDATKAMDLLLYFVRGEKNQYSYQNCWVAEREGQVVAAANVYDGAQLQVLRTPVLQYLHHHYNPDLMPEDETGAGEFYLDTFGVDPLCQGQGIGTQLLQFLIDEYVHQQQQTLGLLVDDENPGAKKLYLRLGFESKGRRVLMGKWMDHLQRCEL